MNNISLQIQSVIYHNEKKSLIKAIESIANAIRVNRQTTKELGKVCLLYGDASKEPVLSDLDVTAIRTDYKEFFDFQYLFFDENTGSAKGHNILGKRCNSEYIMIMNPDVVICPHFYTKMLSPFFDESLCAGMIEARQTPIEHPKEYDPQTFETEWATTACAIIPTMVFNELEGFDEKSFFMYCDDLDFSWRLRLTGRKIYYRPDAFVFHAKTLTTDGRWQPTSAEKYYSVEAALMMAYKWSNMKKFNELYEHYAKSNNPDLKKSVESFDTRKITGNLPKQIDPEHKVSRFVGMYYTEHRFTL